MNELALDQQPLLLDFTPVGWKPFVSAQDPAGVHPTCHWCGAFFEPMVWGGQAKIYCSEKCKNAARHQRRKLSGEYQLKHRGRNDRSYKKLKESVYNKYGNKCNRCGFSDARCLQIDHVKGKGSKERKTLRCGRSQLKSALTDNTGKYQLLCANCNWIKRWENRECSGPHTIKKKARIRNGRGPFGN